MTMLDDMLADHTHYMHGTTKGWQIGCTCPRCAAKTAQMRDYRGTDRPKRRRWTEGDDERLVMLLDSGLTVPQIGEAMGRTRGAVSTRLAERGLRVKRRSGGWTDEEVEILIRLRGEGLTARQVGEALGRTRDAVAFREKALRAAGVEVPRPRPLKETHGTVNCYGAGCRCPECKAAAAANWQERKKRLARKEIA